MRLLCLIGHHRWMPHPDFDIAAVRRCSRCGRVEHKSFLIGWLRKPHLED